MAAFGGVEIGARVRGRKVVPEHDVTDQPHVLVEVIRTLDLLPISSVSWPICAPACGV
jgi:hypothetical protein